MIFSELYTTIRLAVPLILAQLLGYSLPIIDALMAGQVGAITLSAVSLGAQIFTFIYLFMLGLLVAITTIISRYHGANEAIKIRRNFQQGVWLGGILAIFTIILTLFFSRLPLWIGTAPEIASEVQAYLNTMALGGAVAVLGLSARYFLEGMSLPKYGVWVQLALIPLNIMGNYFFLHIVPMGAKGMAIATSFCYFIYTALMFWVIFQSKRLSHLKLSQKWASLDFSILKDLLKIGLPIGVANIFEVGLFLVVSLIVSRETVILATANQIALNYAGLSFMFPLGLAYALTVRTGTLIGQKRFLALRASAWSGLGLALFFIVLLTLFVFLKAEFILSFYSKDAEIIAVGIKILWIIGVFQLFDGIQVCAVGILRGLHDTKMAMYFAILGYWIIGLPTGLILFYFTDLGIYGLWTGTAVGLGANAILGVKRVHYLLKNQFKFEG